MSFFLIIVEAVVLSRYEDTFKETHGEMPGKQRGVSMIWMSLRSGVVVMMLVAAALQVSCGGGGSGSGSDGGGNSNPYWVPPKNNGDGANIVLPDGTTQTITHKQIVDSFLKVLQQENDKKSDPDYRLVRDSTFQRNFLVFADWDVRTESTTIPNPACAGYGWDCSPARVEGPAVTKDYSVYYAVDLTGWLPGMSAMGFLNGNSTFEKVESREYFHGNGGSWSHKEYFGMVTGLRFEKISASPKNLAKIKAFRETYQIEAGATRLVRKYGLSIEKAMEASRFAYKVSRSDPGTYKMSDFDAFSKEFVGSSITEFETDFQNGNVVSLKNRVERASEMTGVGMEGVNAFIQEVFNK